MRLQITELTNSLDKAMKIIANFSKSNPNDDLPTKISKLIQEAKSKTKELNSLYKKWEISRKDAKFLTSKINSINNLEIVETLKYKLSDVQHENELLLGTI